MLNKLIATSNAFRLMMLGAISRAKGATLTGMLYLDEAEPGNPLAADNPTKMWIFYVSCLEFEQWQLQMDDTWLGIATIRTNIVNTIDG